ncbi:MAG: hypothetical protein HY351_05665 [Candidatus Omnitrophica bacterium]|nr:hypothetical protein [Candidatus Omnitrophota bacterium]
MPLSVLSKNQNRDESRSPSSKSIFLTPLVSEPQKLIRWLFRFSGILVIAHLINVAMGFPIWQLERLFGLELESNIPTWFSSVLWLIASVAAYQCFQISEVKRNKTAWSIIALGFLALSIDEVAEIHESLFSIAAKHILPSVMEHNLGEMFKATSWPVLAAPFLIVIVVWLFLTLKRLLIGSPRAAWLLALGFSVSIFAGFGLETITNFLNHTSLQWVWEIEAVFEEWFEMIGPILIIAGLIKHCRFLAGEQ